MDRSVPFPTTRPPSLWRRLHAALGQEMFGRPAGPWGALFAPVPLVGAGLLLARLAMPGGLLSPWWLNRLGEAGWLLWAPFVLATLAQAIASALSQRLWAQSRGRRHWDWSPRRWHLRLAAAIAVLPLAAMQFVPPFLDWMLAGTARLEAHFAPTGALAGYNPGPANLLVLAVLPAVFAQSRRLLEAVPPGRLLGLQRELARLRGAVSWEPEAWTGSVADGFDRWLADLSPASSSAPPSGERQRQRRVRWSAFRREVLASFEATPPDLARANRALLLYRQGK